MDKNYYSYYSNQNHRTSEHAEKSRTLSFALLAALSMLFSSVAARADFTGDEIDAELFTAAAGTFPQSAVVGAGVEYSEAFPTGIEPDPFLELDVDANSFTLRYTNNATGSDQEGPCLNEGVCAFNWGLVAFEIRDLDSIDLPEAEIFDVVLNSSTWPAGAIADVTFDAHSIRIEFGCPETGFCTTIPGFGTVWSASFSIVSGVTIARGSLLGAESETSNLLAVSPTEGTGVVIGATGIVPFTALAKDPTTGVLYGGGIELDRPILYTYQTIIEMMPHGEVPPPDSIDTLIIDWITHKNTGSVGGSDLTYLSITFLDGANNLYHDISIIDGVVQPIGGIARPLSELIWDFDQETNILAQLRNANDPTMTAIGASGTHYQIEDGLTIPDDSELRIERFINGASTAFGIGLVTSQDTRLLRIENAPSLYEIDEYSGAAIQLGILGSDVVSINGADFDAEGQLWAAITVEDEFECEGECEFEDEVEVLARIDKASGEATVVGSFGEECVDGISFDSAGTLWGVSSCNDSLYQIDLVDGEAEFITSLFVGEGGPIPADGFKSLQFDCADTLFAGTGEDDGDGGDLYTIDTALGQTSAVGQFSATDGSSLGGLALHTTCGTSIVTETPEGEDVPVLSIIALEQVAAEVAVQGTTSANICVGRDARWTTVEGGPVFNARVLAISELSGTGSCTGLLVPGGTETWENDLFPFIDLTVGPQFRSYPGAFNVPGTGVVVDYWLVLAVVRSDAEFNGVLAVETIPEDLIDYSGIDPALTPGCDRAPDQKTVDVAGTLAAFGEFPNVEGNVVIVETAQCNRPRGLTRRTTHIYPMRIQDYGETNADLANIASQIAGIAATLNEAAACANPALIAAMADFLDAAETAFEARQYAHAQVLAEELARLAKESVSGFDNCPVAANYRGNFMARGLTLAFTFHDRFEHAEDFEVYLVPLDLEIPLLRASSPDAPAAVEGLVGRAKRSHINLGWQASEGATSYRVFRRLNTELHFTEVGLVVPQAYVDDLPGGTVSAEYYVVADNADGESGPSDIVVVTATVRRRR